MKSTNSSVVVFLKAMLHKDGRERKSAKELIQFEFITSNLRIVEGLRREYDMRKDFEAQMEELKESMREQLSQMKSEHQTEMTQLQELTMKQMAEMKSKHQDDLQQLKDQKSKIQQDASKTAEKLAKTELELKRHQDLNDEKDLQISILQECATKANEKLSKTLSELKARTDVLEQLQKKVGGRQREEAIAVAAAMPQELTGRYFLHYLLK